MRSLFLVMIPSIAVATEIDPAASDLPNKISIMWGQQTLPWLQLFGVLIILFVGCKLISYIFNYHLWSPMGQHFFLATFAPFSFFLGGIYKWIIKPYSSQLLSCSCLILFVALTLSLLAMLSLALIGGCKFIYDKMGWYQSDKQQGIRATARKLRKRLCTMLCQKVCKGGGETDRIIAETLYFAFQGLKSLLQACGEGSKTKNVPEFRLVISADPILLKDLDGSKHYDLLHFLDLQCHWAKEYNEKQDVNPNASQQYFSGGEEDNQGNLLDAFLIQAITQYRSRIPNENMNIVPRGIRVLFSTKEELVAAAKRFADDDLFALEFPQGEILNLWIPDKDMRLFAKVRQWVDNDLTEDLSDKFHKPQCNLLSILQNFIKTHNINFGNPSPIAQVEQHLGTGEDQEKFMFLFVGNHMYKEGYVDEKLSPRLCKTDKERTECSNKYLQYFLIVIMALHYKKSVPLPSLIRQTRTIKHTPGIHFNANSEREIKSIIDELRNSTHSTLVE